MNQETISVSAEALVRYWQQRFFAELDRAAQAEIEKIALEEKIAQLQAQLNQTAEPSNDS